MTCNVREYRLECPDRAGAAGAAILKCSNASQHIVELVNDEIKKGSTPPRQINPDRSIASIALTLAPALATPLEIGSCDAAR